jgi:amino acid transporter
MPEKEASSSSPASKSAPLVPPKLRKLIRVRTPKKTRLGPWYSTAICGNDITSSILYVASVATVYAGILAPLALLIVAGILYLYRKVYTEVVEALPLNGGTYNCLLNSTRKFSASMAACLTLLSYLATSVISAKTAAEYVYSLAPVIDPLTITAGVLIAFALLNILGISESARVALVIFAFHIATLSLFVIWSILAISQTTPTWDLNWHLFLKQNLFWPKALAFGVATAMLGVSGFESSANFVEEQQPGVFRQTLRNMWLAVIIFNPLIAFLALGLMPVSQIAHYKNDLLSQMGLMVGGQPLHFLIVIDAALVLSGAVLTSYVGVTGLVRRMTLDQCFPQFFLKATSWGTYHRIILGFMALCISILYLTGGQLLSLAGVYTISFLGVMSLFGIGNILLKVYRKKLRRTYRAGWSTVIIAVLAAVSGIAGNIILNYHFLEYFIIYLIPAVLIVSFMYTRIAILRGIVVLIDKASDRILNWRTRVVDRITAIIQIRFVLFIKGGEVQRLHNAFEYIIRNESSRKVMVVHLSPKSDPSEERRIYRSLKVMEKVFPELQIEYHLRQGEFGPQAVEAISRELKVPKNNMFIGVPDENSPFSLYDMGGVRVIF